MNTITGVIVGAIIVVLAILGVKEYQTNDANDQKRGSLYIDVTDATANISDVNEVNLIVKKVEVHSATEGWVTVDSSNKTYKLLALNASGKTELYAKADVAVGTYDKVRVMLGDAVVNTKSNGDVKATMPSEYVVVTGAVKVNENSNTNVELDFLADQSLHTTAKGEYVFAAVVVAESRSNATVNVASDNVVTVTGGSVDAVVNVGVDFDGTSRLNFKLMSDSTLQLESSLLGDVKFMLGGKTYEKSDASGEASTNVDASFNTNVNSSASTTNGSTDGSIEVNLDSAVSN